MISLTGTNSGLLGLSKLLNLFQEFTGQCINLSNFKILFSRGTHPSFKHNICSKFGVHEFNKTDLDLGLPLIMGRKRLLFFEYLLNKFNKEVQGWHEKLLSKVGRLVLIKAILQALLIHVISCLKLPLQTLHEFSKITANFCWNSKVNSHGVHCLSWRDLFLNTKGMGLRDFYLFNQALLARQGWKLIS